MENKKSTKTIKKEIIMEEQEPLTVATTGENVENVETVKPQPEVPTEKTYTQADVDKLLKGRFTQEQVNEMIEKRLSRVKKNDVSASTDFASKEELARVKGDYAGLQLKLAEYEKELALGKYKIDEQYKDYVDYKVLHATDKDKDYATALEEFFAQEENKRYLEGAGVKAPMPRPRNSNTLENTRVADNNLRAMFGLGKKQ